MEQTLGLKSLSKIGEDLSKAWFLKLRMTEHRLKAAVQKPIGLILRWLQSLLQCPINDIKSHSFTRYRNSSLCFIFFALGSAQTPGLLWGILSVGAIMLSVNQTGKETTAHCASQTKVFGSYFFNC